MEESGYKAHIASLERENRILKQKLARSEANRVMLEEALETHWNALKVRNAELEESRELIQQSEAKFRTLAHYDVLTGLPNRILFQERLTQAINHAKKYRTNIALLYIDLDQFKPINDNFGHEAGDNVLRETANRLYSCIRNGDTVARIGGDEFAILLEVSPNYHDAGNMAERILNNMDKPFILGDNSCKISISIGISLYPHDADDMETLLQKADSAMYSIKKSSRNGYRFYQEFGA